MKLKTVYSTIALIFIVVGIALWKLNETYRADKISVKQNQLQTQLTALRSSLVSQISQLRNTLSGYSMQIDESKINWVQLKPFYALAMVQEDASNRLTITKLFLQSGSVAERWNSTVLQQYLQTKVSSNQLLRSQTFKDASGLPHVALAVFDREKRNSQPRTGVMVVGDVSYFQRFFDLQRTSSITQVLLTADKQVAAHSEYEYVGNLSDENKISEQNFFVDRQEIRGTNLSLLSYSSKKAQTNLDIPLSMLGTIIGLAFLMAGVLLFSVKPEKEVAVVNKSVTPMPKQASHPTQSAASFKPVKKPIVDEEDESEGLGFTLSAPTPKPSAIQARGPKPAFIPLSFDHDPQIVPIQVQACVQQAVFNIDRQLKASGITIAKEFASGESIDLDYPKFIKIFENVLLAISQNITTDKKRIQLRSYDSGNLTTLEIQAPVHSFILHEAILPALIEFHCEYTQTTSSAGEALFKFIFTRSDDQVTAPSRKSFEFQLKSKASEKRFELTEEPSSDFKIPDTLTVTSAETPVEPTVIGEDDLDIDALLSLDDESGAPVKSTFQSTEPESDLDEAEEVTQTNAGTSKSRLNIEKEMQPSKFKLDEKMLIVEDPVIAIETSENAKADKTKVKIRRPEKG
jgi:hypothetical protein